MRFLHIISKHLFVRLLVSVSLIGATCLLLQAQDWHSAHEGVEYAEVTRTIDNQPVRMNLLRLDLKKVRLDVVHAMDAAIGTETVSSMATRHNAVAAINAGFFRLDKTEFAGDPEGVFVINGREYSEATKNRIALIIDNHRSYTSTSIHPLQSNIEFHIGEPYFSDPIAASGIDRERRPGDVILYGPEFGSSTRAGSGNEIILSKCVNTQEPRGFWFNTCNRMSIHRNSGNNLIPKDGFVISFAPEAVKEWTSFEAEVSKFASMNPLKIYIDYSYGLSSDWLLVPQFSTDVVGGVPQLIKDGKIDITWQEEKTTKSFVETRHPRTAVAKLKDGKFLMITVDGRSESSGGISLNDLAAYLLELGSTDAMNLDGGGSATMFLDGKVVNHPSDKEGERKVSDAILVTLRKK